MPEGTMNPPSELLSKRMVTAEGTIVRSRMLVSLRGGGGELGNLKT
jgi:hypothetical protein